MSDLRKMKWGILGCGNIANLFAGVLSTVDEAELYAIGSRSQERSDAFQKKWGITKSYGSYLDLLEDPEVEIIYIAVTNTGHFENAMLCLEHGKHVLCEKPFMRNEKEEKQVFDKAKEKKLFCMEGMWTALLPTMRDLFRLIHEDKVIGDVLMAKAELMFDNANAYQERHYDKNVGGGALIDTGVYGVKFVCMALGYKPETIKAVADFKHGCDSMTTLALGFKNGKIGTVNCSLCVNGQNDGWIYGTRGYVHVEKFWRTQKATIYIYDPEDIKVNCFNPKCEVIEISYPHEPPAKGYDHEVRHVQRCIQEGLIESPINTWEKTMEVLKIMDNARKEIGMIYPQE